MIRLPHLMVIARNLTADARSHPKLGASTWPPKSAIAHSPSPRTEGGARQRGGEVPLPFRLALIALLLTLGLRTGEALAL